MRKFPARKKTALKKDDKNEKFARSTRVLAKRNEITIPRGNKIKTRKKNLLFAASYQKNLQIVGKLKRSQIFDARAIFLLIFNDSDYILKDMKKLFCIAIAIFAAALSFAENPIVRDIRAEAGKGYKINVFWTLPENPEKEIAGFLIYRDARQIASFSQIKNANPIARIPAERASYTDTVPDLNDYFYCVVALEKDSQKPYDLVLLSFNSTAKGVGVATELLGNAPKKNETKTDFEKLYYDGALRETPLPYIDIENNLAAQSPISDEAAALAGYLGVSKTKNQPLLKPYVFEEDLISPDSGDDYLLFEILKQYFVRRNYKETIAQLNKLAGTNINDATRNRIYFYIGESEYMLGEYRNAVKTFVRVQDIFPTLARKWIDSALDRI